MQLRELFRQLSFGELSNLSMASNGSGVIQEEQQPRLINYTNDALLALYTRFVLKEKDVILQTFEHITSYHLKKRYAETTTPALEMFPYIKDLPGAPFQEDVISILEVYNSDGVALPLNDKENPHSLFVPAPMVLQVPSPRPGELLSVLYQARQMPLRMTPISTDEDEIAEEKNWILNQDVEVPFSLEAALKSYIGYKVYSHMNGEENNLKSQEYFSTYESACAEVERQDILSDSFHTSHTKLENRGFV